MKTKKIITFIVVCVICCMLGLGCTLVGIDDSSSSNSSTYQSSLQVE